MLSVVRLREARSCEMVGLVVGGRMTVLGWGSGIFFRCIGIWSMRIEKGGEIGCW